MGLGGNLGGAGALKTRCLQFQLALGSMSKASPGPAQLGGESIATARHIHRSPSQYSPCHVGCYVLILFSFLSFFFFQYWDLNLGLHSC
jgi:hypothetical protein